VTWCIRDITNEPILHRSTTFELWVSAVLAQELANGDEDRLIDAPWVWGDLDASDSGQWQRCNLLQERVTRSQDWRRGDDILNCISEKPYAQWRARIGVLPCRWYVAREHDRWPSSKLSGYRCLPTVHQHQSPSVRWYAGALEVFSSLLVVEATHWQLGDDLAWNLDVPKRKKANIC